MSAHAQEGTLRFGLVPTESQQTLKNIWQPFFEDMSEAIGIPVKCKTYDDYAGVIWEVCLILMPCAMKITLSAILVA